ncbi:MAG: hypothetical protein ACK4I8_11410 [Armatimonadota bacterium]
MGRQGDKETRRRGDKGTGRREDRETRRRGDKETRRWGEAYDEVRLVYLANRQIGRSAGRQIGKSANWGQKFTGGSCSCTTENFFGSQGCSPSRTETAVACKGRRYISLEFKLPSPANSYSVTLRP